MKRQVFISFAVAVLIGLVTCQVPATGTGAATFSPNSKMQEALQSIVGIPTYATPKF